MDAYNKQKTFCAKKSSAMQQTATIQTLTEGIRPQNQQRKRKMANSLILNSFEIHNFRRFRHLRIERLGRVNLIVGKNKVGKTSLLEALRLYASGGMMSVIWDFLAKRKESLPVDLLDQMSLKERLQALKYLFYGRARIPQYPSLDFPAPITIGPVASPTETLQLAFAWYKMAYDPNLSTAELQVLPAEEFKRVQAAIPTLVCRIGFDEVIYRLDQMSSHMKQEPRTIKHIFLSTEHLPDHQIKYWRDEAVLLSLYDQVDATLRLITPELERTDIVNRLYGKQNHEHQQRTMAKLSGHNGFIPLLSLGEGINRLFEIALALVNAKDGLLLIDEIENGLHYSVQPDVWRMIFEMSRRLNVQVFATSHSWDCIKAFGQAAAKNEVESSLLISLRKHQFEEGGVAAVLFDQDEFDIIASERIEVR